MKSKKQIFTVTVITLFSFMSVFAFAEGNQVLKAGKVGDLRSLEPFRNADPNYIFIEQTFDQLLFNERAQGQLPEAAEKWELAPDNMSITVKLRPNMLTHDGSEVNAEMLKWDIEERIIQKDKGVAFYNQFAQYYKSSEVISRKPHRAPLLGEHNQGVYQGELGLTSEEMCMLKQANII